MKKNIVLLLIALLLIPTINFANEKDPLEPKGTLLETRQINETTKEIFVEKEGKFLRKTLKLENNQWIIIDEKEAKLPNTGLKHSKNLERNESIEKAVENKLQANGYDLGALPNELDLSEQGHLPPVGKQSVDDCVGWATGYYLRTYQQSKDIGWSVGNDPNHIFSPSFIYNQINGGIDQGATLQDAGNLLITQGAATLTDFPYIEGDYYTQPTADIIQKAQPHRIRDWYILYTDMDSADYIVNKTKEYLNTGDLPVVGIDVGFKWMYPTIQPDGTSIVTTENYTSGGHAVAVVGYDDNIPTPEGYGAFKIVNSYGQKWGDNGYTYMTYNAFANAIRSGFVYTDMVNGQIVDYMDKIDTTLVNDSTVKFSWPETVNASGYKVLDEGFRVIANVYAEEYYEEIDTDGRTKRYFQAFNSMSTSNVISAEVDLNNSIQESITPTIKEDTVFNINFNGIGIFDLAIKNISNELIYSSNTLNATNGLNTYRWNGKNSSGENVQDGTYKIAITTYDKNDIAKEPVTQEFTRQTKLENTTAIKYKYGDAIYKVESTITVNENSEVTIIAGENTLVTENLAANETKTYTFDYNDFDLSKVDELEIKVK